MVKNFIQKIFGKGEANSSETDRAELTTAPLAPEKQTEPKVTKPVDHKTAATRSVQYEPPQFIVGLGQSVGRQRDQNQDSMFAFTSTLASSASQIPFGLYIVADGMGGHQHGEVASDHAVRIVADYILRNLYIPLINPSQQGPTNSLQDIMRAGVMEAHNGIQKKAPDGGTTLTAALILGQQMTVAHVGDSRAYLIDMSGGLTPMTRDHSLVKRLQEMGQITAAEASTHPQRNVLYRALGQGEPIEPEIQTHRLPKSGYLMICSDGLWGVIPEEEITRNILTGAPAHQICQNLVQAANDAGGPDNITVILVQL